MGDKEKGGLKNLKKRVTSFMDGPITYLDNPHKTATIILFSQIRDENMYTTCFFVFQKYGKFRSVSLGHFKL